VFLSISLVEQQIENIRKAGLALVLGCASLAIT
jgi:hypothetical protein